VQLLLMMIGITTATLACLAAVRGEAYFAGMRRSSIAQRQWQLVLLLYESFYHSFSAACVVVHHTLTHCPTRHVSAAFFLMTTCDDAACCWELNSSRADVANATHHCTC
jgi:hypothetical protein